jgi:hypothetical protein
MISCAQYALSEIGFAHLSPESDTGPRAVHPPMRSSVDELHPSLAVS